MIFRPVINYTLLIVLALLTSCAYTPSGEHETQTYALLASPESRIASHLGEIINEEKAVMVEDAEFALRSRVDLIEASEHSIDVQYFIWQNDPTGIYVIEKLLQAADRGVRVRALVDDIQVMGLVSKLDVLDDHPNIEIRSFNPFSMRMHFPLELFKATEFAIDGNRLNHRMHNKLLVADNQLAILGGRNIGDDYFGYSKDRNFIDTDILLSGEIVRELSAGFDSYWNSRWAFPVSEIAHGSLRKDDLEMLRDRIHKRLAEHPELYTRFNNNNYAYTLDKMRNGFHLDDAATVIDDPSVRWFDMPDEIAKELTEVAMNVQREVLIVSPYLVPTENLFGIGRALVERSVSIKIVTNGLATNDIVIAHSAYARFRKAIIETGVELYEMRADPEFDDIDIAEHHSLHSKYIIFDDEVVFVGSLNLDRRSLYLNTELGVVLRSRELADYLRDAFNTLIKPENSWRLTNTDNGLRWTSSAGIVDQEPEVTDMQRFSSEMLKAIPVSSQL
jgi:putative cardiolipin synthase